MDQRAAAQTFTAVNGGKLTSARVLVLKDASEGTGDYVLKIAPVNASGVPTAEVLAQAPIPGSSVPDGRQTITANFDPASAPTAAAGQKYALVVQRGNNDTMLVRKYEDTCSDVPCRPGRRRLADPAGAVDCALSSMRGAGGRRGFEARWRPPLLRGGGHLWELRLSTGRSSRRMPHPNSGRAIFRPSAVGGSRKLATEFFLVTVVVMLGRRWPFRVAS